MPGAIHPILVITTGAAALTIGVAVAADAMLTRSDPTARADIRATDGRKVGVLRIEDDDHGRPELSVNITGLPAGYHGFHLHAKGVCDPKSVDPKTGSPFFSAGPHFDLHAKSHPDHSGDLPDLLVGADGTGSTKVTTDRFHVDQLLDGDGSALVVHALPDNQANIPKRYAPPPDAETLKTGDSGGRIACGVVQRRS